MPAIGSKNNSIVIVKTHVSPCVRDGFSAWARALGLSTAAALRHLMTERVSGEITAPSGGVAEKITIRLRDAVRARLKQEATAYGTTPTSWATSMLEARMLNKLVWNRAELAELRLIRASIKEIRARMKDRAAADRVDAAVSKLDRVIQGKLTYWGVTALEAHNNDPGSAPSSAPTAAQSFRVAGSQAH